MLDGDFYQKKNEPWSNHEKNAKVFLLLMASASHPAFSCTASLSHLTSSQSIDRGKSLSPKRPRSFQKSLHQEENQESTANRRTKTGQLSKNRRRFTGFRPTMKFAQKNWRCCLKSSHQPCKDPWVPNPQGVCCQLMPSDAQIDPSRPRKLGKTPYHACGVRKV